MRISDWSSDVCSSDLRDHRCHLPFPALFSELIMQNADHAGTSLAQISILLLTIAVPRLSFDRDRRLAFSNIAMSVARSTADRKSTRLIQSLMRISYAVFCLKKKIERQN